MLEPQTQEQPMRDTLEHLAGTLRAAVWWTSTLYDVQSDWGAGHWYAGMVAPAGLEFSVEVKFGRKKPSLETVYAPTLAKARKEAAERARREGWVLGKVEASEDPSGKQIRRDEGWASRAKAIQPDIPWPQLRTAYLGYTDRFKEHTDCTFAGLHAHPFVAAVRWVLGTVGHFELDLECAAREAGELGEVDAWHWEPDEPFAVRYARYSPYAERLGLRAAQKTCSEHPLPHPQPEIDRFGELMFDVADHAYETMSTSRGQSSGKAESNENSLAWAPKAGFVGSKSITSHDDFKKNGINPKRSTLQYWAISDNPESDTDPMTHEVYYQEEWVRKKISTWAQKKQKTEP